MVYIDSAKSIQERIGDSVKERRSSITAEIMKVSISYIQAYSFFVLRIAYTYVWNFALGETLQDINFSIFSSPRSSVRQALTF